MTEESELIAKITEHLLDKLKGRTIMDIEKVELREVDVDPRSIDVYDSNTTGELVVRIKYH